MASCLSRVKFLFFCLIGFLSGFTFNLWVMNEGLIPGISAVVQANTSRLFLKNLTNSCLNSSWSNAPIYVTFSGSSIYKGMGTKSSAGLPLLSSSSRTSRSSMGNTCSQLLQISMLLHSSFEPFFGLLLLLPLHSSLGT